MSLKEQIAQEYLTAYKSKDELKVAVLRLLKSVLQNSEIAKKEDLTDDDVIAAIKREVKQRKETIETYKNAGKTEAIEAEEKEIAVLEQYLPNQLSEEDTINIVDAKITELGATDVSKIGQVIGAIMKDHGGEIDGGLVAKLVNQKLRS